MATNVLDLYARVRFDSSEFNKGLSNAESSFSAFGDKISAGVGAIAKATAAAVAAGAAAVGKMVSESVSAYSSYEQLVGGVQTLFGNSADTVLANADKAYKTAGMSVNQYMETTIQSAAAMISSLEGDQATAAELMDMSIVDMSDNVNKMGTTMEAVQNAYRGFSRQNFTMLDNLALGFAGTKAGMQDLLDRAQQISGVEYNIESYSDIVKAIHVVQQEMGITGTTSKEAADTIQGSAGSMKAAWQNLKVELAKENGDIGESIDIMISSVMTTYENIGPKIKRALGGMSKFVSEITPIIAKELPKIIKDMGPDLFKSSAALVSAVIEGLVNAIPSIADVGFELMGDLLNYLPDWLNDDIKSVASSIGDMIDDIDFDRLSESFANLGDSLEPLAEKLSGGIAWAFENVLTPFGKWLMNEALPPAIDALSSAFDILGSTLDFLEVPATAVWEEFLKPLAENLGDFTWGSLDLLAKALGAIADEVEGVDWSGFWMNFDEFADNWEVGAEGIADFLDENFDTIKEFFSESEFGSSWFEFWEKTGELIQTSATGWIAFFDTTIQWIKDFAEGWVKEFEYIGEAVDKLAEKLSGLFSGDLGEWLYDKLHPEDIPAFGDGGHVSRPTFAIVGEKEPETIIPDSKLKYLGGNNITVNLNVEGGLSSDYDTDRLVERLSEKLAELNIMQTRAIGGTGYNG